MNEHSAALWGFSLAGWILSFTVQNSFRKDFQKHCILL